MKNQLIEDIRQQTLQAIELAEKNEIEQCNIVLSQRQQCLEKLLHDHVSHINEKDIERQSFIELMHWIQKKDEPIIKALEAKKEVFKQSVLAQSKKTKALKHYKNTL